MFITALHAPEILIWHLYLIYNSFIPPAYLIFHGPVLVWWKTNALIRLPSIPVRVSARFYSVMFSNLFHFQNFCFDERNTLVFEKSVFKESLIRILMFNLILDHGSEKRSSG